MSPSLESRRHCQHEQERRSEWRTGGESEVGYTMAVWCEEEARAQRDGAEAILVGRRGRGGAGLVNTQRQEEAGDGDATTKRPGWQECKTYTHACHAFEPVEDHRWAQLSANESASSSRAEPIDQWVRVRVAGLGLL
uniref:Uncharacterized protein n=1 Tax=Oryza nivara TaxID=4536 RepID=A0A0E0I5T2_ORYNI